MSRGKNKPFLVVLCTVAASGVVSLTWAFATWQTSDTSDQAIILFFYGVLVLTFLSTGLAFALRPRRQHPTTATTSASTSSSTASDAPPEYRDTWRREYKKKIRHEISPEEPRGVTGVEVGGRTIGPDVEDDWLPPYSLYSQEAPTLHTFQSTPTATEIQEYTNISQPEPYTGNLDRLAWVFRVASQADTQTNSSQPEGINARNQDSRPFPGTSWADTQTRSSQPEDSHTGNRHQEARLSTRGNSRVGSYTFSIQREGMNTGNPNQPGVSLVSTYTNSSPPVLHAGNQDRLARVSTRGARNQNQPGASRVSTYTSSSPPVLHAGNQDRLARVSTRRTRNQNQSGASRVSAYTSSSPPDLHFANQDRLARVSTSGTRNPNQPGASQVSAYTSSSPPDLHTANQDRLATVSTRGTSRVDDLRYETGGSGESLFLKAMLHHASSHPP